MMSNAAVVKASIFNECVGADPNELTCQVLDRLVHACVHQR